MMTGQGIEPHEGAYATGRLEDSGRQNDEKLWRETVHSQSEFN